MAKGRVDLLVGNGAKIVALVVRTCSGVIGIDRRGRAKGYA